MTRSGKSHNSDCSVAFGTDIIGDRWTLLILRDMMFHRKCRFSEFAASKEKIATNILTTRLVNLEADGLIDKIKDPKNRRNFVYLLTEKGWAMAPILFEIVRWGAPQIPQTDVQKNLLQRINTDPEALLQEFKDLDRIGQLIDVR